VKLGSLRFYFLILLGSLIGSSFPALSAPLCSELFVFEQAPIGSVRVSQEIELRRNNQLTKMIVPTVPMAELLEPIRTMIIPLLRLNFPQTPEADLFNISWEELNSELKNIILSELSQSSDFNIDRSLPNFTLRTEVTITPRESFQFLGLNYEAGREVTIDMTGFLHPVIEFGTVFDPLNGVQIVEMHFRGESPIELRNEIYTFFNFVMPALGETKLKPWSDHQHVIAPVPVRFFARRARQGISPTRVAAEITLYHQALEIMMILINMKNGVPLVVVPDRTLGEPPVFNYLRSEVIPDVYDYFLALQEGRHPELSDSIKYFNVGLRSEEAYTGDGLWGLEFRFMNYDYARDEPLYGQLVEEVVQDLSQQDFDLHYEWPEQTHWREYVVKQWWQKTPEEIVNSYSGFWLKRRLRRLMRNLRDELGEDPFAHEFDKPQNWFALIPFVLFRWDLHPLFQTTPQQVERIVEARQQFLDQMRGPRTEAHVRQYVLDFVEQSGMDQRFAEVFGLTLE
jgi:hypothetical protein